MTSIQFQSEVIRLQPLLKPIAMKFTRDEVEADDLIQDTMVKAITNREKFMEGTNLKAWVYTIMKNTFITNYHRIVKRRTFVDSTANLYFINNTTHATQNEAGTSLAMEEIHEAIEGLNHDLRTSFLMYYKGYKYHEIADILSLPLGTVKNRIHIARKQLKTKIKRS